MADMNFGEPSGGGFVDSHFDFSRCQRPDGSFYGTSGQCRKGTPVSAKEKADLQARASRGDKAAMKKLTELRAEGKIGKESGFAPGSKAREATKETKQKASIEAKRKKLEGEMKKVKEQIQKGGFTKELRAKRSRLEEAMNKLRYEAKGLGGGQSKLTGADVKRAVGTAD